MKLGAIFDMDGLLFDTEIVYNQEWYRIANQYHLSIQPQMLDELRGTNGALMNTIVNRYWPTIDAKKVTDELFQNAKETLSREVPMKPGVIELLTFFHKNKVKMAVASSAPLELIKSNLKVAKIDFYFDVVVSGKQVTKGKPAPDLFLLAAKELKLNATDCYVLEDAYNGVEAGYRAGCTTIMVPDLLKPTKRQQELCSGIYSDLFEVKEAMQHLSR